MDILERCGCHLAARSPPAHYHSLLVCLAAIALLFQFQRGRRDWIAAGLLLGLLAGFNFTLAATFGISAVGGVILLWLQGKKDDSLDLVWLASFVLVRGMPCREEMASAERTEEIPMERSLAVRIG